MNRWSTRAALIPASLLALVAVVAAGMGADTRNSTEPMLILKGHTVTVTEMSPLLSDMMVNAGLVPTPGNEGPLLRKLMQAQPGLGVPETTSQDFTMYITDSRMLMDVGTGMMAITPTNDAQGVRYLMIDRTKGTYILFTNQSMVAAAEVAADARMPAWHPTTDVTPTGRTRQIQGYTAQEFVYRTDLESNGPMGIFDPGPGVAGQEMRLRVITQGEMWLAKDAPGAAQVAEFYRRFAAGVAGVESQIATMKNPMMSGLTAGGADLASRGVPLASSDSSDADLRWSVRSNPHGSEDLWRVIGPVIRSHTTTTVTSLSMGSSSDVDFYENGPPPGLTEVKTPMSAPGAKPGATQGGGCDCSCNGYKKFQQLSKRPKKVVEADPNAMKELQCARSCISKWMSCPL
jgi:hypothetical protein